MYFVHFFIREKIKSIYDTKSSEKIKILYGGSVKPENARDLFLQPDIDGGLIGGACLNPDSFFKIILSAE